MAVGAEERGYTFDPRPPAGASDYFRDKNLRPAFRWTEVWGEEHAHAFTVAKAVQLDVLGAIRDSLQRAIDDGRPYRAWAAELKPELQRLGWWGVKEMADPATGELAPRQLGSPRRLRTIYDANLRTARAAGQWERAQRTKAVLPYFVYGLGPSIHHRPEHEAREGMVAPVDDPIWNSWYPPNGWGCKCWLRQVTRSEADRLGGPSDLGDGELAVRTFTRTRDDGSRERVTVPKGIDPGWASNPGKARSQTLMRSLTDKLETAGPEVARAAIASLWRSQVAEVLPLLPDRTLAPVAVAPPGLKAELGAADDVVKVGSAEMAAKLVKHGTGSRGLRASDFGRVQQLLDEGERRAAGGAVVIVAELADGWWELVVKTDRTRRELLVSTLHPIKARRGVRVLRR